MPAKMGSFIAAILPLPCEVTLIPRYMRKRRRMQRASTTFKANNIPDLLAGLFRILACLDLGANGCLVFLGVGNDSARFTGISGELLGAGAGFTVALEHFSAACLFGCGTGGNAGLRCEGRFNATLGLMEAVDVCRNAKSLCRVAIVVVLGIAAIALHVAHGFNVNRAIERTGLGLHLAFSHDLGVGLKLIQFFIGEPGLWAAVTNRGISVGLLDFIALASSLNQFLGLGNRGPDCGRILDILAILCLRLFSSHFFLLRG